MVVPEPVVGYDPSRFQQWLASLTPLGSEASSGTERPSRTYNFAGMTPHSAARQFDRIRNVQELLGIGRQSPPSIDFVDGPVQIDPPVSDEPIARGTRADPGEKKVAEPRSGNQQPTPVQPAPTSPNNTAAVPTAPQPQSTPTTSTPAPTTTSPALAPTAEPTAPRLPATSVSQPWSLTGAMLGVQEPIPAQTQFAEKPYIYEYMKNIPVAPGDSTTFAGVATVTVGIDETIITGVQNPTTGENDTTVRDRFGEVVSQSHSEIVPGTGGLTRDATITDKFGTSKTRTVDDGQGNRITWTANPDGSHSVHYSKSNIIVVEPAPGSTVPAQVIQLNPDGTSGYATMWHSDGRTSTAEFQPSLLGTPVTEYTRSDGPSMEVLTVPDRTNGKPSSIVTDHLGNRSVVRPDGTTTPVDEYNAALSGTDYGNTFDPMSGRWVPNPIVGREALVRIPDGTSIQKWHMRNPDGSKYELDAYFDEQGNLRGIGKWDSGGLKYTSFRNIDGILVSGEMFDLDSGSAEDNRQLVYDGVMILFGIPEMAFLGARLGVGIGSRYFGSRLASQGVSLTGRELAIAGLGAGDTLTGVVGGARSSKYTSFPAPMAPGYVLRPPLMPNRVEAVQLSASAPRLRPNGLGQPSGSVSASVPEVFQGSPRIGSWIAEELAFEAKIASVAGNSFAKLDSSLDVASRSRALVSAGTRNMAGGTSSRGAANVSIDGVNRSSSAWHTRWLFGRRGGNNANITFYHGTTAEFANIIRSSGVQFGRNSPGKLDFGPGFYTSREYDQAIKYAQSAMNRNPGSFPGIVEFRVPRSEMSRLARLNFPSADGSWANFISRFRRDDILNDHAFDVVEGPILSNLPKYLRGEAPTGSGTQTSWHTKGAIDVLNRYIVQ
ncbi:DUF3990 domain-containing protein [Nocardia lasii]|uniref:DUF3990 domain-containing protein n=1 Tax=Nocardia lasii TaxID=1616107 RepID=A0ABW1JR77_9NOCA